MAGAQAKTALLFENGRWSLPSGALATSHILKPAVAGLDDHDMNEHLCLEAARRAGLICARTRIANFENESAIVIDRYDRALRDGAIVRIHQGDLCQAFGIHPSRKYQSDGGPGPEQIVGLFRSVMEPSAAEDAVRRFVDALAWNWIIGGTDAHAKNYSLLLSGGQVRLAPLYDIASALPYLHEKNARMAMKVGRDYALYNYRNPRPRAAAQLQVDEEWLCDRVLELATLAPDAFSGAANQSEFAQLGRPLPQRLIGLVAERAVSCQRLLRGH
ncbi:MAG: HipA domain-containing protein [Candidatus Dormibacteraceae bacterium]